MSLRVTNRHRIRRSFGKINPSIEIPHLLRVQLDSYEHFLQCDTPPGQRKKHGLEEIFQDIFPISDFGGGSTLEYVHYRLGEPKHSVEECRIRGVNYSCPIRVALRLIIWNKEEESDVKHIWDIKEQDVYLGEIPLMTSTGSFIINGTERVIVSQMHKSPGAFFTHDKGKTHASGKLFYSARLIPHHGSWLDIEFDAKDLLYARIDRRRKFLSSLLLRALGYTQEELLDFFYDFEKIDLTGLDLELEPENQRCHKTINPETIITQRASCEVLHPETGAVLLKPGQRINKRLLKELEQAKVDQVPILVENLEGNYLAKEIRDTDGNLLFESNTVITSALLRTLQENNVEDFEILYIIPQSTMDAFRNTLELDKVTSVEQAMIELYKRMKPGDPPSLDAATTMLHNFFFNPDRYSLLKVGRLKINEKLGLDYPLEQTTLTKEDILLTVKYLLNLKEGKANHTIDDIDHLGNRRVRSVGELLESQFRIGLRRMSRTVTERMSLQDSTSMMIPDIVNAKPVSGAINEFFGSSQLSQFMDQTNPLSEVTHKRRLSALGPGGLTRERAGFDVRDVHTSHYGRICPIETPEGPNIGLIASLASYARINRFGFIEPPYRKVVDGKLTDKIEYLSAIEEERYCIAQANANFDENDCFVDDFVGARLGSEFTLVPKEQVNYIDVSPQQLVSVAASLIPFLEHDDANRALMGSNMQRQGVPLVKPKAPLVGTGMEHQVALDSGSCVLAKRSGIVDSSDASRIVIQADVDLSSKDLIIPANVDIYHLTKYKRSNQNTCINQRPLVGKGDYVRKGDIIADGSCTENGELALGQNIRIAFMPWRGYNFEDSIMVSQRLLHEDTYTSVHIDVHDIAARDTKLGKEEITADLPNVNEDAIKNLDVCGIIKVGTYVRTGDILVGRVTPKGESQLNPEEKLLRAVFGEKAGDVRDSSLRMPQGSEGVVVDVVLFNREGVERDERTREIEQERLATYTKDHRDEIRIVHENLITRVFSFAEGIKTASDICSLQGEMLFPADSVVTEKLLAAIPLKAWEMLRLEDEELNHRLDTFVRNAMQQVYLLENIYQDKCEKLTKGVDLPAGVIRMVKVYVAVKRKLSVGDKMAGRHGNKGVVSTLQPIENMPYMKDGTPIDIVLNPLGVPSRMNVGQILETHLGGVASGLGAKIQALMKEHNPVPEIRAFLKKVYDASYIHEYLDAMDDEKLMKFAQKYKLGIHMATPVFDGAEESDIHKMAELAELPTSGQYWLYDGLTGERFSQKITVGQAYIMKLHHLVDDKIHARSIGPYSLVTQQPLGGKAQFGGQRFGEMEVWALEAYGAAHTLQELLTVKSDDVAGRNKIYENIVKGQHSVEIGLPESFKVLISELRSLCLNVELLKDLEDLEDSPSSPSLPPPVETFSEDFMEVHEDLDEPTPMELEAEEE